MVGRDDIFGQRRRRRQRGFLAVDAVIGIGIVLVLLMMLSAAIAKERHAERGMADRRAAVRQAETALFELQAGEAAPPGVRMEKLPDAAPAGYAWMRVTEPAAGDLPAANLVGLVPIAQGGGR
jgi:hypothetical protein